MKLLRAIWDTLVKIVVLLGLLLLPVLFWFGLVGGGLW